MRLALVLLMFGLFTPGILGAQAEPGQPLKPSIQVTVDSLPTVPAGHEPLMVAEAAASVATCPMPVDRSSGAGGIPTARTHTQQTDPMPTDRRACRNTRDTVSSEGQRLQGEPGE